LAKSKSQLLARHKSIAVELVFVITYVVILAIMALVTLAAGENTSSIYVFAIVSALAMSPVAAFMGGLRYEVGREKLIIRSGLLLSVLL
jgi:membrane protein YdbS with pleckstrin-like domain